MELLEKLKHLEENIKVLYEIKESISLEDVKSNKRYEWEIRYGLLESIQIVIDISCNIVSKYNLGNPNSYKKCIELLTSNDYLSKDLSKNIVAMVGLRNILVHEYVSIDDEKLYSFLNYLEDFIKFSKDIKNNVN